MQIEARIVKTVNSKNSVMLDNITFVHGTKGYRLMTAAMAAAAGLAIISIAGSKWAVLA